MSKSTVKLPDGSVKAIGARFANILVKTGRATFVDGKKTKDEPVAKVKIEAPKEVKPKLNKLK